MRVNRVEVIRRGEGKLYVNHEVDDAWVSVQDDGKTIKVFIDEPEPEPDCGIGKLRRKDFVWDYEAKELARKIKPIIERGQADGTYEV